MKLWKHLLPLALAAALLASCGGEPQNSSLPESSAAEESVPSSRPEESSSPESQPESSETSEPEKTAALTPVRTMDGDYDRMTLATYVTSWYPNLPPIPEQTPYYAVEKNGLWGLVDENGTELLPCKSEIPTMDCPNGHWIWWGYEVYQEEWEAVAQSLEEATGKPMCPGHGASSSQLFATQAGDPPRVFWSAEGAADIQALPGEDVLTDKYMPTLYTPLVWDDGDAVGLTMGGYWNLADRDGKILVPGEKFQQAGWFGGEALAPVQKDGKWAYVAADGTYATDFVYDSTWGSYYFWDEEGQTYTEVAPCYAYCLWNGTAPVCRDGKWGVIDGSGAEIVPCIYDGAAPYPGGAWLKSDGQWTLYSFE